MAITITSVQRDAFYEQFWDRLDAIEDIRLAVQWRKFDVAQELARNYSDDLEFICTDLGWGDRPLSDGIELETPPDVLRRIFSRVGDHAADMADGERAQAEKVLELDRRNRILVDTCRWGLEQLESEAPA